MKNMAGKIIILVLLLSCLAVFSPAGQLGVGLDYTGIHVNYGNNFKCEARMQAGEDNTSAGLRLYRIMDYNLFKNYSKRAAPYFGGEVSSVTSKFAKKGGMITGGFGGVEVGLGKNLFLLLDAGIYYITLASSLGSVSDTGITINTGLTYYIGR